MCIQEEDIHIDGSAVGAAMHGGIGNGDLGGSLCRCKPEEGVKVSMKNSELMTRHRQTQ